MQQRVELRGMAWNHPRALDPLAAISAAWSLERDQVVLWDARPLKDFEDQPLDELAAYYDLLLIDYPFVAVAATSGLIAAVDDWVPAAYLADQARHAVGPSFESYGWGGRQWALAIDAACQVAAVRDDLLASAASSPPPDSWHEVAALARAVRHSSSRVALPLNPNHAYCAFLSVAASEAGGQSLFFDEPQCFTQGIKHRDRSRVMVSPGAFGPVIRNQGHIQVPTLAGAAPGLDGGHCSVAESERR